MVHTKETKPDETFPTVRERKRFTILGVEFEYLAVLGIATAFIGWIVENLSMLISYGTIDARHHILPFIAPYALVIFALHLALGSPDHLTFFGKPLFQENDKKSKLLSNLLSYIIICAAVFFGELIVGSIWDGFFGVRLWDYSEMPLHITPYTGVISTFGFGTGVYLIFKFIYAPVLNLTRNKLDYNIAKWITYTLGVLIVLDNCTLMVSIVFTGNAPMLWSINFW